MISRSNLLLVFVSALVAGLVMIGLHFIRRAKKTAGSTWEVLVNGLQPLDNGGIAAVALNLVDETGHPRADDWPELSPAQIWELTGGMQGLERLGANCDVLIELAAYLQQWYPEALPISEELRRNAREVKWHIERLHGAAERGHLETAFADYASRAVATYYLMTRELLSLYRSAGMDELNFLEEKLA